MSLWLDTPEKQAAREQFKQNIEAQRLALKNAPKLAMLRKEKPTKK
jgi:hypothetical protein